MVAHDVLIDGVRIEAPPGTFDTAKISAPVILTMRDDDFPGRFLRDLLSRGRPQLVSSATLANIPADPLFQPVQRMMHVAMVQIACNSLGYPRLDPKRVASAGIVIRRLSGDNKQAWMRSPNGLFRWINLTSETECQDPDPALRPAYPSGQAELDQLLAALRLTTALTESSTPAFVAPPNTCAELRRTVLYGIVPTASSEMSDALPVVAPPYDAREVERNLPTLLRRGQHHAPVHGYDVNYSWMSDDFLSQMFPPSGTPPKVAWQVHQFQNFSTALRMLKSAFGAFDDTDDARAILNSLNRHSVTIGGRVQAMGDFYKEASSKLLDYDPSSGSPLNVTMPDAWDALNDEDVRLLVDALRPRATSMLMPQGRFQDYTRSYCLRVFVRVKSEHPSCPPELVWSAYSAPFRIAAWFESSGRPHVPVPLPDPTDRKFLQNLKHDCSFAVPGNLMGAMQGSSMSGLMNGAGGGPKLSLGWLCSFSIPLITICAFFVLNIFLGLLNIVFFWMAFIKICIPIPVMSDDQN